MIKKIIFIFLAWRISLFIPLTVSVFLPSRIDYGYTLLPYFLDKSNNLLSHFLLYPFANFDGIYYLLIAANGYTVNAGFFPMFPLSIHIATLTFGNMSPFHPIHYFAGILLVGIYFLFSLVFLFKLVKIDYKENITILTIFFLLIFPTSFFYAAIYSESLFLFLSLLIFYLARKKKWFLAGIAGIFLSATRLVGIMILPSLLYEYFKEEKKKSLSKLLSILLLFLGLIAYVFYNLQKWGNAFYFIQAQGNFANNRTVNSIILLPQTIFRYFKILIYIKPNMYEWWVAFFELSFCIFALSLLYIAWKKRVRFSYILFGLLCFIVPVSSGTFTGLPRYISVIFPIFIALALIKNKFFKIVYTSISILLLFIFFMLFSKGYFIA